MMGYSEVSKSYQRALGITREILGDNHLLTAYCHYHIGSTQTSLTDYTSALQSYKRVLEIKLNALGESHLDTALRAIM